MMKQLPFLMVVALIAIVGASNSFAADRDDCIDGLAKAICDDADLIAGDLPAAIETALSDAEKSCDGEAPDRASACVTCELANEAALSDGCAVCVHHTLCAEGCDADDEDCLTACDDTYACLDKAVEGDDKDENVPAGDDNETDNDDQRNDENLDARCTPGTPDCNDDGTWETVETGGRVGSCAAGLAPGAGGGWTALLFALGFALIRRKSHQS